MKRILAVPISFLRCLLYTGILYSFGFAGLNGAPMDGAKLYRFSADHKIIQRLESDHAGVIVDELTRYETAYVWATPLGVASLSSAGHFPEPVIDEIDWWNVYPTYQQVNDSLIALAGRQPALARIDTIGYSYNHHPLVAITISNQITQPNIGNKPGIMLIGAIHGNEKPGAVLLMNFAEWLLDSVNVDWRMVWLRQDCRFQILPIANPDGYLRNNRMNGHSVDINRSFPDKTTADSNDVTTGREPETQAIMRWTQQTKPMLSIDFHDGMTAAVYPNFADRDIGANYSFAPQPDRQWYTAAADSYAVYNPPMWNNNAPPFVHGTINAVHAYQAHGSLPDYHYYFHWCRHLTVELANEHTPPAEWLPTMWETNKNSILAFSTLIQQGIELTLTTGSTPPSDSAIADLNWGYPRYVRNGMLNSWRFLLSPGEYYPRIFDTHTRSTYRQDVPMELSGETPATVIPNFLRQTSGSLTSPDSTWETQFPIRPDYRRDDLFSHQDSLSLSPMGDYPIIWHGATVGSYDTTALRALPDTMPLLIERRWILWDHRSEGVYLPLYFLRNQFNTEIQYRRNIDTNFAFTLPGTYGEGNALQYTPNGRQGGGLSDSPTGNYPVNYYSDFIFGPVTLTSAIRDSGSFDLSFSYRGNMETWADYWVIFYSRNGIDLYVIDTLTGVVPNWRLWQKTVVVPTGFGYGNQLFIKIGVHSDNTDARDGYTIDDLTICHWEAYVNESSESMSVLPQRFSLSTAPNPFNAISQIKVTLPREGVSSIVVYDVTGRLVETLQHGRLTAGSHSVLWNAKAYSSGVYFVRASTVNEVRTTKVVLLK